MFSLAVPITVNTHGKYGRIYKNGGNIERISTPYGFFVVVEKKRLMWRVQMPKTWGDIADHVGMRRDLLVQALKEVKEIENIVTYGARQFRECPNKAEKKMDELLKCRIRHYSQNRLLERCRDFRDRSWWQDYSKIDEVKVHEVNRDEGKFQKANRSVDLIRCIEKLGRLCDIWDAFANFCMANGRPKFHIEFLETKSYYLQKSLVRPTLEKWRDMPRTNAANNLEAENFDCLIRKFDKNDSMPLWFHCELQLLAKFHASQASDDCYHYFGSSQHSCLFCWAIIHAQDKFRTGWSLFEISPNCAFPFAISNATWPLITALKVQQENMLNFMTEQAVGSGLGWTEYERICQTTV